MATGASSLRGDSGLSGLPVPGLRGSARRGPRTPRPYGPTRWCSLQTPRVRAKDARPTLRSFRRAAGRLPAPGSRARQVPPPLRGQRSAAQARLCARGHLPRGSNSPAALAPLRGPVRPAVPGSGHSAQCRTAHGSSALRACRPPAEQSAPRLSPPADPPRGSRGPAPAARLLTPRLGAPQPPAGPRWMLCHGAPPRPRLLLIGCRSLRRPAGATAGALNRIPPLPRGRPAPPHFLFPP